MNLDMSIPPNYDLNLTDGAIEENIGEESKETSLSREKRVHGPSLLRHGQSRGASIVNELDASCSMLGSDIDNTS